MDFRGFPRVSLGSAQRKTRNACSSTHAWGSSTLSKIIILQVSADPQELGVQWVVSQTR